VTILQTSKGRDYLKTAKWAVAKLTLAMYTVNVMLPFNCIGRDYEAIVTYN
jgi:hypothetical protein